MYLSPFTFYLLAPIPYTWVLQVYVQYCTLPCYIRSFVNALLTYFPLSSPYDWLSLRNVFRNTLITTVPKASRCYKFTLCRCFYSTPAQRTPIMGDTSMKVSEM